MRCWHRDGINVSPNQSETVSDISFVFNFLFIFACALQFCRKWVVYNGGNVGMRWKRLYVQFRLAKGLTLRLLNHQHPFRINSEYHLEHHQSIGKFRKPPPFSPFAIKKVDSMRANQWHKINDHKLKNNLKSIHQHN